MARAYMLDTDVCSYIIRENPPVLEKEFIAHQKDDICISSITYAELLYGAQKKASSRLAEKVRIFTSLLRIVDFEESAAKQYALARNALEAKGSPVSDMDLLIAACAMASGATLVTHNRKHFGKISGLKIEDWTL